MVCRNCGKPLPKGAKVCPDCGTRVPGRRWLWGSVTVVLLVLLCSAALIFFNLRSRSELPELSLKGLRGVFSAERQTPDEPPVEEAEPVAEIEAVAEPEPVEEPVETAALEDTTVLDAAFEEPEPVDLSALSDLDYYRAVETRGFTAWSERLAALSDTCRESAAQAADQHASFVTRLELTSAGQTLFGQLLRCDLGWLKAVSLACELDVLDQQLGGAYRLLLNEQDVLSAEMFLDAGAGALSLRVPALSESTLATETAPESAQLHAALAALPEGERVNALLTRYFSRLIESIDTVQRGEGLLEAEGLRQRCTTLTVELPEEAFARLVSSLVGELRWDEELAGIIRSLASAAGADPEASYAAFLSALDELDYELATAEEVGDVLRMTLYVDEDGAICGRRLRLVSDYDSMELSYALPREGERFGLELRAVAGGELLELSGRGEGREDGVSGTFLLRQDAETLLRVGVESIGEAGVTLRLEPAGSLRAAILDALPEGGGELSAVLRYSGTQESCSVQLELLQGGERLCLLELSGQSAPGASPVPLPAGLDAEAWAAELDASSADDVLNALGQAGLPAALQLALRAAWRSMFTE